MNNNSYTLPTTNNNNSNGNYKINNLENENKHAAKAEEKIKIPKEQHKTKSFKKNKHHANNKSQRTRKISVDELFENKENNQNQENKNDQKFEKANDKFNRKSSDFNLIDRKYFSIYNNPNENDNPNSALADNATNFNNSNKRFKYFYPNRHFGRISSLGYKNFRNYNWNAYNNYPYNKNLHSFKIPNSQNNNNNNYFNQTFTKNYDNQGYFQNAKRDKKLSELPMKTNLKFDNYFSFNPNQNLNSERLYSNNFNYFGNQTDKTSLNDKNLNPNKYDNIKNRFDEKAGAKNLNLFSLWDQMNAEKTAKKKWLIKSQNQINYGPFSNEEIYNYLKTTLTTNPNSELLKNSIIIDSEMDIYFKPDSALEVIQQEIKDITLPPNPKDELEKILIKVTKNESEAETQNPNETHEEETDALQNNSNFVLEENSPSENQSKEEPIAPENNEIDKNKHKPAEGEFVSAADLYNFIYHHQKKLNSNQNKENNDQNLKEVGVKSDVEEAKSKAANQQAKDDAHLNPRLKRMQFPQKENQMMNAFDQGLFQNTKNAQNENLKRIKSFSFANSLNLESHNFLNRAFNKFDLRNNLGKTKDNAKQCIAEKDVSNSKNSEKENKRPNVITAIIKPISIEEIFATDKKPADINLPNPEILKEIKDFLFNEKNEIKPHDRKEISENQNLKNLMDLGITPKIEFRKQSVDLSSIKQQQPASERSEGQIKHFLGKKVDGSIARDLNKSKGSSLSNKFDIPLNKICFTRKLSHATTNATKSNPSSNRDSDESPVNSPHTSPVLESERRKENLLADSSVNKNESFKKRRIDVCDLFHKNKQADASTNKENIDKNLKNCANENSKNVNTENNSSSNLKNVAVQDLFL